MWFDSQVIGAHIVIIINVSCNTGQWSRRLINDFNRRNGIDVGVLNAKRRRFVVIARGGGGFGFTGNHVLSAYPNETHHVALRRRGGRQYLLKKSATVFIWFFLSTSTS